MAVLNGRKYLESLRDDREIWLDGERVGDVTRDRRLAGAAQTLAELYDLQNDPELIDVMTFRSPSSGERVGMSFIEPRSVDDLVRRREMVKRWMDHTCGMFGRSMDFMNIMMMGMAAAWRAFERPGHPFGANLRAYFEYIRENDLALTHTLVNPQIDRARPVERQTKDVAAKVVKETDAGIVVSGARMVSTLCAFSHEIQFAPSTHLRVNPDSEPYALAFCIPIATPGLRFMCRPSLVPLDPGSPMDYPLSSRLDEGDGVAIFDNVFVPWERVFVYRDVAMVNGLFNRTGTMPHMMHQFSTKNLAKAEFMMALGFAMADSSKVDAHLHVQNLLAELINYAEFVRACLRASEADAVPMHDGVMTPAAMPLWTVRQMFPRMFHRMCEIIHIIGAGGIVSVPSFAELGAGRAADAERYFQAANSDARRRIKLMRLAFDAALSSFSGRQQLYERYYSGDPVRLGGVLYDLYDKAPYIERIHDMLDDLEARQLPRAAAGPAFAPHRVSQRAQAAE